MEFLEYGSTGPIVELLQSTLMKLGFFRSSIDGIFGNLTLSSVINFQINFGLVPDGIVGIKTWSVLLPYINGNSNYIIRSGDTLSNIALKFNSSIARITFANPNLDTNNLNIGQKIIVPFGTIIPTNISYSSKILNLNLTAIKTVYPFLSTGIIGYSVLGNSLPYIKIGSGINSVFYSAAIHRK